MWSARHHCCSLEKNCFWSSWTFIRHNWCNSDVAVQISRCCYPMFIPKMTWLAWQAQPQVSHSRVSGIWILNAIYFPGWCHRCPSVLRGKGSVPVLARGSHSPELILQLLQLHPEPPALTVFLNSMLWGKHFPSLTVHCLMSAPLFMFCCSECECVSEMLMYFIARASVN